MRVELKCNLKGQKGIVWGYGSIFDSEKEPIPPDIIAEVKAGRDTVIVIEDVRKEKEADIKEENDAGVETGLDQEPDTQLHNDIIFKTKTEILTATKDKLAAYMGITADDAEKTTVIKLRDAVLTIWGQKND